jgi:hypothetical protein
MFLTSHSLEGFQEFHVCFEKKPIPDGFFESKSDLNSYLDCEAALELLCRPLTGDHFHQRIEFAEQSRCSDPRDRTYAFLSIPEQGRDQLELIPNYRVPVATVSQAATLEVMKQVGRIDILSWCELRPDGRYRMPSWVPELSTPRLKEGIESGYAADESLSAWTCLPGGILRERYAYR